MVKFTVSKSEADLIAKIADRAGVGMSDRLDFIMDITATHCNGNPLRLPELLAADDFNFAHDINGIRKHLDRRNGKLSNCFVPRFSKRD